MSSGAADAALGQHALQLGQVGRRQRPVHPQLVDRDVVLVLRAGRPAPWPGTARSSSAAVEAGQLDVRLGAHLVLEVGVDRLALLLARSASPGRAAAAAPSPASAPSRPATTRRSARPGSAPSARCTIGMARLLLQQPGDRLHLVAQARRSPARRAAAPAAGCSISRSNRFASSSSASSSDGSPATSCASSAEASAGKRRPRLGLGVLLDQPPLRPDDEVVQVHRRDFALQQLGSRRRTCASLVGSA